LVQVIKDIPEIAKFDFTLPSLPIKGAGDKVGEIKKEGLERAVFDFKRLGPPVIDCAARAGDDASGDEPNKEERDDEEVDWSDEGKLLGI
jgi:hypothetical protein